MINTYGKVIKYAMLSGGPHMINTYGKVIKYAMQLDEYYAYADVLGVDRDTAKAILWGVNHLAKLIPQAVDIIDEAKQAVVSYANRPTRDG